MTTGKPIKYKITGEFNYYNCLNPIHDRIWFCTFREKFNLVFLIRPIEEDLVLFFYNMLQNNFGVQHDNR